MTNIRRLSWEQFHDLQDSFRSWLCGRSGLWFFEECESRFTDLQRDLNTIWKDRVLAQATFKRFAKAYLNTTASVPISYNGDAPLMKDIAARTEMFATRVIPGEGLVVTWGNDNFYPATTTTFVDTYSRIGSSAQTEIQIVSTECDGTRLFPIGSSDMTGDPQDKQTGTKKGLLPFPSEWKELLGHDFVPIYNLFDLHNSSLLVMAHSPDSNCPNERKGPTYLFLLTPAKYLKPDVDPIAQFENEARPGPNLITSVGSAKDDLVMLTRQFWLIGCDSLALAGLKGEWSLLLERALAAYKPTSDSPVNAPSCGSYANGVFAGKSFVELRHHFSINGHPADSGARNLQTIGQVLGASFAATLNRTAASDAAPFVRVVRSPDVGYGISPGVIQIRFYTTMSQIFDEVSIFEGDEIRVGPISEDLRKE